MYTYSTRAYVCLCFRACLNVCARTGVYVDEYVYVCAASDSLEI